MAERPYAAGMLVGRPGLSPVMVGRAAELGRLAGLIGASPAPAIALIAGEAGIGKTRLVQELVEAAAGHAIVLAGQADPGSVGRPMDLLLDAVHQADLEVHEGLRAIVRDPGRTAEERTRSAVELVRSITAGRPGLIVFEDLHWADAESLATFEQLAKPDSGSLVLVGTYRPEALSRRHPAADLLPRLEHRHAVTHLQLNRLSPADVSTYLAAVLQRDPSFRAVDALHTRSGGNPFFLEELVASAGGADADALDTAPLPWTIAEVVRSQMDDLDPEVRSIVAAAAVLGRRVSFDLLAAVTATPERALIDHLRVAVDRGLLVETDADVFGFHHDLAREAIDAALLGRERRRLHQAALDALRAVKSRDHVALTHHAAGAGRYDEMVEEARLGAHDSLDHGSTYQALQLAEAGLSEVEDDLDLRSAATRAAWLADLLEEAVDHSARWLEGARSTGDISQEAAALSLQMRITYGLGDLAGMTAATDALIDVIERLPTEESRARAMAVVAQSYMLRDLVAPTCEWADRAVALADAHGLHDVRRAALVEKGSVLVFDPLTSSEGERILRDAVAEADAAGDHLTAAQALSCLVWKARQSSRLDEARELLDRMRHHAESAGFDALAGEARVESLAALAVADGDLPEALAVLGDAERLDAGRSRTRSRRWLAVFRAGLALEDDDLDGAASFIAEAKPTTARSLVGVLGLDLNLAARRGDLGTARAVLHELLRAQAEEGYAPPSQVHDLLASGLRAGLTADELRPMVEMAGILPGHRLEGRHPLRELLKAQLAEAQGDTDAAARLYASSATGDALGHLARHRGTAHVGAARCLIALGDLDGALPHAEAAATHLARWRGWRVAELLAVQRRLGIGTVPDGPDSLTPREREVAALIAEGLTNAGLADRLFISPRTAAVHVSNILSKLGMSSRAEVAAWAVREGVAAQ